MPEQCPKLNEGDAHAYWDWTQAVGTLKCLRTTLQRDWIPLADETERKRLEKTVTFLSRHIDALEAGYHAFEQSFGRPVVPDIYLSRKRKNED